jgi:putative ABC transport system substrate-binding protein
MDRRNACRTLAAFAAFPVALVDAQPSDRIRVAWVSMDHDGSDSPPLAAFRAGMATLGHVEGRNLTLDGWWGQGSAERLQAMADDPKQPRPDVFVTQGGSALAPLLAARVRTPIVFGMSADPVEAKIVESYARPGGNITGVTLFAAELTGKRLGLLKVVLPDLKRVAVIANPQHPGSTKEVQAARDAAAALGLAVRYFPVQTESELDAALAEISKARIDAAMVIFDGFALENAARIGAYSVQNRIAVVAGWATAAQRGSLMAYGPVSAEIYRRVASYVDLIHKGAKPGDLPIEQPTQFEFVVNLHTAKALGLTIPASLLASADKVIQ